jgi:transposase
MEIVKYVGLDVHQASISYAVLNGTGKLISEGVVESKRETIVDLITGMRGAVQVVFEEGCMAAWLYDLLKSRVAKVTVCDPRKNVTKKANKSDRIDAHRLAELLRLNSLTSVYQGENSTVKLRELARCYTTLTQDCTRTMNRIKAIYRGRAIGCAGSQVYSKQHREEWLKKLQEEGVRSRAASLYQLLDMTQQLRREARKSLIQEARKHTAYSKLKTIPCLGPIRVSLLLAWMQTAHRFRTKRQLWAYSGLALEVHDSGEYRVVNGELARKRQPRVRGLNVNHNRGMKDLFKSAAVLASSSQRSGQALYEIYQGWVGQGVRPEMARLTLARKIAAIVLTVWKKGEEFNAERVKQRQASLSA